MSFMFTWLRMSSNKILTWARNANYQSKVGTRGCGYKGCAFRSNVVQGWQPLL